MNKLMDQVVYRTYSPAVETAREYYNSDDADNFYSLVWGGEDIHVGLYHHPREPVYDASRRTVAEMAARLPGLDADTRVLDIGAGYGGSARYLAHRFGCRVTAFNLSERENERGRRQNREQGVDALVEVIDGSFEDLPFEDDAFDDASVIIAGEITTSAWVDLEEPTRQTVSGIGYDSAQVGFDGATCAVLNAIGKQSPDIAGGVDRDTEEAQGAGDQGMMFGYACNETDVLMPAPITYAHRLVRRQSEVRRRGVLPWLRPDATPWSTRTGRRWRWTP